MLCDAVARAASGHAVVVVVHSNAFVRQLQALVQRMAIAVGCDPRRIEIITSGHSERTLDAECVLEDHYVRELATSALQAKWAQLRVERRAQLRTAWS